MDGLDDNVPSGLSGRCGALVSWQLWSRRSSNRAVEVAMAVVEFASLTLFLLLVASLFLLLGFAVVVAVAAVHVEHLWMAISEVGFTLALAVVLFVVSFFDGGTNSANKSLDDKYSKICGERIESGVTQNNQQTLGV